MAGLIPDSFIDELLDRTDIVSLVDSRVKLKKTGKNFSACCPFHDEKTPSFTVSQDKQFYYCFGCGANGDALRFLMDYERLDFIAAVTALANLAGLAVPREERSQAQQARERERKSLYSLLGQAADYYTEALKGHAARNQAVNYLKARGLTGAVARDFGIGFAPPGWDNLLKALGQAEEDKRLLIEGGMLVHQEADGKLYDRFRARVVFPIRDQRGRVIGFGGRVLDDSKPKYLNSPETPVFHKGRELYGLYEARQAYKELPRLLVVEGYMDVVALAQFGLRYAVATLGTACGPEHLQLAFKHASEVVFCFDGDQAGRGAARRALESALPVMEDGRSVRFLFLPEGEDPDSLVRQIGPDKFEALLRSRSVPLEQFLFDLAGEGLEPHRLDDRARLSKRAAPLIEQLPKGVFHELMLNQLAARTGLDRATLQELAQSQPAPAGANAAAAPERDPTEPPPDYEQRYQPAGAPRQAQLFHRPHRPMAYTPVRLATALLLYHAELVRRAEAALPALAELDDPDLPRLHRLVAYLASRPPVSIGQVLGHWRGSYGAAEESTLGQLAGMHLVNSVAASDQQAELRAQELTDILAELGRCLARQRHQPLLAKAREDFGRLSAEEREQLRSFWRELG